VIYQKVKKIILLVLATAIFGSLTISKVGAIEGLLNPYDLLSNGNPGAFSQHSIRFGVPFTSPAITTTDSIFINMPFYSMVSEPTYISGSFTGVPTYQVFGNFIKVTGINVSPGNYIYINGITAYNPELEGDFAITIWVSSDPDGLLIKNQATVMATKTDGSIVISASISAYVGTLRISGICGPGMFITFVEDGAVIGTAVANNSGVFTQIFPGITPKQHFIQVFGVDGSNRITPPTPIEVYTKEYEMTTVSGILLPPTISLDKEQIQKGESLVISGLGVPNYKIIIYTEPPLSSNEMTIDEDGAYSQTISDTASLELGEHRAYSLVQDGLGSSSLVGFHQIFKVVESGTPPEPGECDFSRGDLNCDTHVNLADFSILLYYWGLNAGEADVNADGNVNLIDFSIMMFYWGE
jgi:hypothetical protein